MKGKITTYDKVTHLYGVNLIDKWTNPCKTNKGRRPIMFSTMSIGICLGIYIKNTHTLPFIDPYITDVVYNLRIN